MKSCSSTVQHECHQVNHNQAYHIHFLTGLYTAQSIILNEKTPQFEIALSHKFADLATLAKFCSTNRHMITQPRTHVAMNTLTGTAVLGSFTSEPYLQKSSLCAVPNTNQTINRSSAELRMKGGSVGKEVRQDRSSCPLHDNSTSTVVIYQDITIYLHIFPIRKWLKGQPHQSLSRYAFDGKTEKQDAGHDLEVSSTPHSSTIYPQIEALDSIQFIRFFFY